MSPYQTFTGTINAVHQSKPFTSTSGKPVVLYSLYLFGVTGAFRHGEQPVPAQVGDEVTFQARPAPNKPGQFYVLAGSLRTVSPPSTNTDPTPVPAEDYASAYDQIETIEKQADAIPDVPPVDPPKPSVTELQKRLERATARLTHPVEEIRKTAERDVERIKKLLETE